MGCAQSLRRRQHPCFHAGPRNARGIRGRQQRARQAEETSAGLDHVHGDREVGCAIGYAGGLQCPCGAASPTLSCWAPETYDTSPCGASLSHCQCPVCAPHPALSILGGLVSPVFVGCLWSLISTMRDCQHCLFCSLAWVRLVHNQSRRKAACAMHGIRILQSSCHTAANKCAKVLLPVSCCPARGPSCIRAQLARKRRGRWAARRRTVSPQCSLGRLPPGPCDGPHAGHSKRCAFAALTCYNRPHVATVPLQKLHQHVASAVFVGQSGRSSRVVCRHRITGKS